MYSNNILNLQESMTILNACTKKVWKLIEDTMYILIWFHVTDNIPELTMIALSNDS